MSLNVQNFLLFQLGWFSCVIAGATQGYTWAGVAVVAVIVFIHLARATEMRNEIILILLAMSLGTAWDSSLTMTGIFNFSNGVIVDGFAPYWIVAMWALFATTLNVSMKWMKGRYLLAAVFGAVGGPLAYFAGYRLGAVEFSNLQTAMLAIGAGWAVMMPTLVALADRFNGFQPAPQASYKVEPA